MGSGHDRRRVKGVNLVGLVKMLKVYRRAQPLQGLSPEAAALVDDRILVSSWYPLDHFLELLQLVYRRILGEKPEAALAMGLAGGKEIWTSAHRGVVAERDAVRALLAMGPTWATYFDFGSLEVTPIDPQTVRFTVKGYGDVPMWHGMTIAGWHLAAAHVSGAPRATVEIIECPWKGALDQVHVVRLGS